MIDGYTLNGTTPGPMIRAEQGQMIEVRLVNESVAGGITLHWHGYDVPAGDDGVAGVTQDAVPVGGSFVYRFRAEDAGTYWYHSHQVADAQVQGGLFGALVVTPRGGLGDVTDILALTHTYQGRRTVNGLEGGVATPAAPLAGPRAGGQHRQRAVPGLGRRCAVPSRGDRRHRRRGAHADHRCARPHRGRPGRPGDRPARRRVGVRVELGAAPP